MERSTSTHIHEDTSTSHVLNVQLKICFKYTLIYLFYINYILNKFEKINGGGF
jgi:hypothetical protein